MVKILLNIFTSDIQEEDFYDLAKPYDEEGYSVYNFKFPISEYYLDMVDTLLNYLSAEHNVSPYETKIALQSNISNLLVSWYRLYNDVIDDFILIDRHMTHFHSTDLVERSIIDQLSSLAAFEQDSCHNRFYYRVSKPIPHNMLQPFMESYQYDLLKPFEELNLQAVHPKKKFEKGYVFNNWSYKRVTSDEAPDVIIDLSKRRAFENNIQIDEIKRSSGFYFTFQYILDLPIHALLKAKIAGMISQRMSESDKSKVTEYALNYLSITKSELPFKKIINIYSFLVLIGTDKTIMKQMLKYLTKDEDHLDDHYAILTNALFYLAKANQEDYDDYFVDRVEIMRKLKEYYKPEFKIKTRRSDNHLVIVTGQLLSYNHAPTKIAIDYANNLIKYHPELKIKIVVDDMFNYSPNELFFVHQFSSAESIALREEHKKLLNPSIKVYYSNSSLPRIQRLENDIKAITDFRPQWILKIGAPDSLAVDQLYDYYPVSSFSMARAEYSEFVDLYTGGHTIETIQREYLEKNIKGREFIQHNVGIEHKKPKKMTKSLLDIPDSHFVLVTVGNRLAAEVTEEFVHLIADILKKNSNITWCIVGSSSLSLVDSFYKDMIEKGQIKYFNYVSELLDFYTACDVFVNPFRKAGGNSAAMAMSVGLPVVSLNHESDVIAYIGIENGVDKDFFASEIDKLYLDKEYYKAKSKLMQERLKMNFSFEQTVSQILNLLKQSEIRAKDRVKRRLSND
ncbi:glycosyltransferase [Domibacillus iocasae]|uniref:Uncharacterized protein n=1 Tax=Domibacillus iocasae TaxID=1714016 RepID=A0A1E7DSK6_9BACI|nr:glycosyltransferase [Domibacillus iocasae]OES46064.1 hypothetical protein BA724_15865 [Domibacillus iocasae]